MSLLNWNKSTQEWEVKASTDSIESDNDIEVTDPTMGIILVSATKRWRVTCNDSGVLVITEIIPA